MVSVLIRLVVAGEEGRVARRLLVVMTRGHHHYVDRLVFDGVMSAGAAHAAHRGVDTRVRGRCHAL